MAPRAAVSLPTPTIRRRLASMLYESLLLGTVFFFGFLLPQLGIGVAAHVLLPHRIVVAHALLVAAVYFLWFWHRSGRTLAMQTWKIELRAADGGAPSLNRLMLRFVFAWPSILLGGIGIAWALVDRDRQFLHDRLAGTRLVLREQPKE